MRFNGIQALRAFSAVLVVVEHSVYWGALAIGKSWDNYLPTNIGTFGVLQFFTISGAAMCIASENTSARNYIVQRAARIYPPYLAALVLATIILLIITNGQRPVFDFDLSMVLLPSGGANSSFAVPYGTLIYEVAFYSIIALLLLFRATASVRATIMCVWAIALFAHANSPSPDRFVLPHTYEIFLSPMCAFFASGYVLMFSKLNGTRHFLVLVVGLVVAGVFNLSNAYPFMIYATLNLGLLAAAMAVQKCPRPLVRMGDFSYGIYLMHDPIVYGFSVAGIGASFSMPITFSLYFSVALTVAFVFGWAEYQFHRKLMIPHMASFKTAAPAA